MLYQPPISVATRSRSLFCGRALVRLIYCSVRLPVSPTSHDPRAHSREFYTPRAGMAAGRARRTPGVPQYTDVSQRHQTQSSKVRARPFAPACTAKSTITGRRLCVWRHPSTFSTALALALALDLAPKRRPAAPSFPRIVVEHHHGNSLASQVNSRGRELRRASNERLHARGLGVRVSLHRLGRSSRAHPRDVGGRQSHHQALNGRVGRRRAHGAVLKLVHLRGCS